MVRDHDTSMSDLSLFLDEPAAWFIKHIFGYRTPSGPKAHLGLAVEFGLTAYLTNPRQNSDKTANSGEGDKSSCAHAVNHDTLPRTEGIPPVALESARRKFAELVQGELSDEITAAEAQIEPMLARAISEFNGFGSLVCAQKRVDYLLCDLRTVGYIDYVFREPRLVDLKTTQRLPSSPKPQHVRQVAFYSEVENIPASLVYVTPKKSARFDITDEERKRAMKHIMAVARAISAIRKGASDVVEWAYLYPPRDMDSFYYDDVSRYLLKELYDV